MISQKLKGIFFLSILLFYAHVFEEIFTDFYRGDPYTHDIASFFTSIPQAVYWVFHISWGLFLLILFFLSLGRKWILGLMTLYGLVLILEVEHLFKAVEIKGYSPGMITALFFPIIALFFWRELLKNWRQV